MGTLVTAASTLLFGVAVLTASSATGSPPAPVESAAVAAPTSRADPASPADRALQPLTDYDQDGCYPARAMTASGVMNPGLPLTGGLATGCRSATDLTRVDSYARTVCGGGWCARMYAYYFEKDQIIPYVGGGHRHDIEHVIIWSEDTVEARPRYVSVSQHGDYDTRAVRHVRMAGTQAKVVYHKDFILTHAFRFATAADEPPENHAGVWQAPPLVNVDRLDPLLRSRLFTHDFGRAKFDFTDERFLPVLRANRPPGVSLGLG